MATTRTRRILSYVAIAAAFALLFLIPSSYVVARGGPVWLAAVIGGLAFPVVPGGWHLVAEWRRRRRGAAVAAAAKVPVKPAAGGITGRDRFTLRMIVVALVAVAPLVVFDRGRVWTGLRHHAAWFIPADPVFDPGHARPLMRYVPADAELLVVARDHPKRLLDRGYRKHGAMVTAMRAGQTVMVFPTSDAAARELTAKLVGRFGALAPAAGAALTRDDAVIVPSGDWGTAGTGPGSALTDQLIEVPTDAVLAIAFVPTVSVDKDSIRTGRGWVSITATGLAIGAHVEMADAAKATELVAELNRTLDQLKSAPICKDAIAAAVPAVHLAQAGAVITARIELSDATIAALADCTGIAK